MRTLFFQISLINKCDRKMPLSPFDLAALMVAILGISQAGFFILLLRQEGPSALYANRWLYIFILCFALIFLRDAVFLLFGTEIALMTEPLLFSAYLALGPAIFLYVRTVAGRWVSNGWWHFVSLLVGMVFSSILTASVFARYGDEISSGAPIHLTFETDPALSWFVVAIMTAFFVYVGTYHLMMWRAARSFATELTKQGTEQSLAKRQWIGNVVRSLHLAFVVFAGIQIIQWWTESLYWAGSVMNFVFLCIVMRLSFLVASQPFNTIPAKVVHLSVDPLTDLADKDHEPLRSLVDTDESERIRKRLDVLRTERNLMFDPLLTMPKLASAVGATPNQLSFVLNRHLSQSFFEFVNTVRIEEAVRLLLAEPNRPVLDIAMAVGFNSKSTFNLAFRRVTGTTPSKYRVAADTHATAPGIVGDAVVGPG
ncbi:AraC-like DNA-binding protein [Thalassospira sp. MBR-102]